MGGVKNKIEKLIGLVSSQERRKNREVEQILYRIECLLLWLSESIHTDTKDKNLDGRVINGK
jgi:hypothetical protein